MRAAWLTLKHHRFEIGFVVVYALILAVAGVWINQRLLGFEVPRECFDTWLSGPGEFSPECFAAVQEYSEFLYGTTSWFDVAMLLLPFAAGTLAGVSLVGRELESRTAQTGWSLSPSRPRWLIRQLWPVLLVVGLAVGLAALSAALLHNTRISGFPPTIFQGLGFQGLLVVARFLAAFGIALLAGSLLGRVLPAWIVAALACFALVVFGAIGGRQSWLASQPGVIVEDFTQSVLFLEQLWREPEGTLIGEDQAFFIAATAGEEEDPYEWLATNGYKPVARVVTAETAAQWEPMEIVGTFGLAVILLGATFPVVNRRRPT